MAPAPGARPEITGAPRQARQSRGLTDTYGACSLPPGSMPSGMRLEALPPQLTWSEVWLGWTLAMRGGAGPGETNV